MEREWWLLKHEDVWLLSRREAAFCGLVLMTLQNYCACMQTTQADCRKLPTSSYEALENSPDPTTRGTRCKKMEAGGRVVHGPW